MRPGHLVFSAVHFCIILIFFSLGLFFLCLFHLPHLRILLSEVMWEFSSFFKLAGYGLTLLSLLLLAGFFLMHKGRYYQIRMKTHSAAVDLAVVESYIEKYWKELFPHENVIKDVILYPNQKIEIIANLSHLPFHLQKQTLEKVERELGSLLSHKLGYNRDFHLTVIVD